MKLVLKCIAVDDLRVVIFDVGDFGVPRHQLFNIAGVMLNKHNVNSGNGQFLTSI